MSLFGSPIAAGINAGSQWQTNLMNYRIARMTNKANLDLAKQQNEWNVEQWNRENKYNSPEQQVKRLTDAGLSQAAASQAIEGAGNASPLQSADLANQQPGNPMIAPDFSALSGMDLIGTAREFIQLRKDMLENKKLSNEVDFQVPFLWSDLDAKMFANKLSLQELTEKWQAMPYRLNYLKWNAESEKQNSSNLRAARKLMKLQHDKLKQDYDFAEKWQPKQIEEISQRITNLLEENNVLKKKGKLLDKQSDVASATAENIEAQTEGQKTHNKILQHEEVIAECEKILKEFGSPSDQAAQLAAFVTSKKMPRDKMYDFFISLRDCLNYGSTSLVDSSNNEYVKEYFENYWNQGAAAQGNFGLYQGGFMRPFSRRTGLGKVFMDLFE